MTRMRRKLGILLILAAAALPLAVVSVAYACGVLATLHLDRSSVAPGGNVSGTGRNYNASPKASLVSLHFNSRSGRVLWAGHPDLNGAITPSFTAPKVRAGYYLIDATQTTATGNTTPGTPGRAVLRIGNPKHAVVSLWPSSEPGSGISSSSTASPGLAGVASDSGMLIATLSGGLLAGGVLLLLSDRRRGRRFAAPAL